MLLWQIYLFGGGLSLNLFIRDDLGRENEGIKINGNATLVLHLKS